MTKQKGEDVSVFIHLSNQDLSAVEKTFVPRIPSFRLTKEDASMKRICVADSIAHAISSFPYKSKICKQLFSHQPVYLAVYPVKKSSFKKEEIKTPEELQDFVPDAVQNREHWILKEFTSKPYWIRIRELKLSGYDKYTDEYIGKVIHLVYEKETEPKERIETATFFHKQHFKAFQYACKKSGMNILNVEAVREPMQYFGCIPSSRIYTVRKVTYQIPSGVSAQPVWQVIHKEMQKNRKKRLIFNNDDFK